MKIDKKLSVIGILAISTFFASAASANIECQVARSRPMTAATADTRPITVSIQGNTPQEIQQRFAAIQQMNFQNTPDAARLLSKLSDKELSRIAVHYNASNTAGHPLLLNIMARRLDSKSLVRVSRAFGSEPVRQAVQESASPDVQKSFARELASATGIIPLTAAQASAGNSPITMAAGPAPNVDMTIEQIYLEFRTAPVGSLSVQGSIGETIMFAGSRLSVAVGVGSAIGSAVSYLLENYDPDLNDAIGGTVDGMMQRIQSAGNAVIQGAAEQQVDSAVGFPLSSTGNYSGDYDVGNSYEDFEASGGGGSC